MNVAQWGWSTSSRSHSLVRFVVQFVTALNMTNDLAAHRSPTYPSISSMAISLSSKVFRRQQQQCDAWDRDDHASTTTTMRWHDQCHGGTMFMMMITMRGVMEQRCVPAGAMMKQMIMMTGGVDTLTSWCNDNDNGCAYQCAMRMLWMRWCRWPMPQQYDSNDNNNDEHSDVDGKCQKWQERQQYLDLSTAHPYFQHCWKSSCGLMGVNPTSFLLHFAYAEMQEACKESAEVNNAWNKILDHLCVQLEELETQVNSVGSSVSSDASGCTVPMSVPNSATSTVTEGNVSTNSSFVIQSIDEKPPKSKELQDCWSEYPSMMITVSWSIVLISYGNYENSFQQALFEHVILSLNPEWAWPLWCHAPSMSYVCRTPARTVATPKIRHISPTPCIPACGHRWPWLAWVWCLCPLQSMCRAVSCPWFHSLASILSSYEIPLLLLTSICIFFLLSFLAHYLFRPFSISMLNTCYCSEELCCHSADPPIKCFAQHHTYLGTDAIAMGDLGFAMAGHQPASNAISAVAASALEKCMESLQSLMYVPWSQEPKRQSSPDLKWREDSEGWFGASI